MIGDMGHKGGLTNPCPGRGQNRAGFSTTGGSPQPQKMTPCQNKQTNLFLSWYPLFRLGRPTGICNNRLGIFRNRAGVVQNTFMPIDCYPPVIAANRMTQPKVNLLSLRIVYSCSLPSLSILGMCDLKFDLGLGWVGTKMHITPHLLVTSKDGIHK